jgi:hypothetical protein
MAVDFSLLPPEEPNPDDPPSRLVWVIVFFVLVLAGVFAVLLLWPKNLPTHTWKFWTCLVLFPVGIPTLVVMRRFSHYEALKMDAELRNEATRGYTEHVFEVASRPLALAASAYRFSSDPTENSVDRIRGGGVTLVTQPPIARDGEPAKARWLVVPGVELKPGGKEDDLNRHMKVTQWLFTELLEDLSSKIHALPARLELDVHLVVSGGLTQLENKALWQECWRMRKLRPARIAEAAVGEADLAVLDAWLDEAVEGGDRRARLIVAIQLHPLLNSSPPTGMAEAGAVALLMPHLLADQYAIPVGAHLHRPVRGPFDQSNGALSHALKWANVLAAKIPGGWQTGLNATQAGALREPSVKLGLTARATDLDQTVGDAFVSAPWLAIACAAASVSSEAASQIIFAGQGQTVDCAVLRWAAVQNEHS